MNPVGEPDAGNLHVRFDERGGETERLAMPQATAPLLDSTHAACFYTSIEQMRASAPSGWIGVTWGELLR
jgi:hypothetical protein